MRRTKRRQRRWTTSGGQLQKEPSLWMRRSEDVPSDELASFYSLLSHDGKENLSVKHFNVLGQLASELCQSNKEIT